jgi:hypothetical protein
MKVDAATVDIIRAEVESSRKVFKTLSLSAGCMEIAA